MSDLSYTYLIGWSYLDKWYYGVRYARNCHPDDLWTKYWTSSGEVKRYRKDYGEPDVIEVRQIFNDSLQAREWESKVLRRMGAVRSDRWLNKQNGGKDFNSTGEETRQKISASLSGKLKSEEHKKNIWKNREHLSMSEDQKEKISKSLTGRKRPERTKDWCLKISRTKKGLVMSDEFRKARSDYMKSDRNPMKNENAKKKLSEKFSGISRTEEDKEKIRLGMKSIPKVICEHCGKEVFTFVYKRWHGDKCKIILSKQG